jgi:hypothetical protein
MHRLMHFEAVPGHNLAAITYDVIEVGVSPSPSGIAFGPAFGARLLPAPTVGAVRPLERGVFDLLLRGSTFGGRLCTH